MIVLSLFDGISCGRLALQRAGISVERYYASEIAAIYEMKKSTYLERIQKTTGRTREAYEDCLSLLEKMKSESENR